MEKDKDSLLESGPGIEIQEAKPTVEEEEMERVSSWYCTWMLNQLLQHQRLNQSILSPVSVEELEALFQ
eukprot:2103663-Amphidinium_carterae.1